MEAVDDRELCKRAVRVLAKEIRHVRKVSHIVIRGLRVSSGLSQRAFAEMLGITNVHLCNIEHGRVDPTAVLMLCNSWISGMR